MSNTDFDPDLLDTSFDDLADYVGFQPLPRGDYLLSLATELAKTGEHDLPTVKITFTVQEVVQLVDEGAVAPEAGRKFTKFYILRDKDGKVTDWGEGLLKKEIFTPIREAMGGDKFSELLNNTDGAVVAGSLGIRKRKDKETGEIREENTILSIVVAS